jgi:hypothetical protein
MQFTKGGSQKGKNLELKSEFVKRSLLQLSEKLHAKLDFTYRDPNFDDEKDGILKIYRYEQVQSDTEVFEKMSPDCLVFLKSGDEREHFTMSIYRGGICLKRHAMRGMSDYFFQTIYLEDKPWLCFLYNKQQTLVISGMALCIVNYETGELVFNRFVRPGKA